MKPLLILALLCAMVPQTWGAETKLICGDKSESAAFFRKQSPSLGVDVYAFDAAALLIRQIEGELKDKKLLSVGVTETEIHFEQIGYINEPQLTETFRTTISRVSGKWVRYPHYVNQNGRWMTGGALEQVARTLNLWGPFGVRQGSVGGECSTETLKF